MTRESHHFVELAVNGTQHRLIVDPGECLLDTLRDRLMMTDIKWGCREGACGACTVLLDGHAVPSCLVLTATLEGAEIITPSGLADLPAARRIVATLTEAHAFQCGFCAPGILIQLWALFAHTDHPTKSQVEDALGGHICRCGGHQVIVESITAMEDE